MAGLVTAWRAGEVRPTHERSHKPARYWRTRIDPLAHVWPKIIVWLEAEPDRTALELLHRLMRDTPGAVEDKHLRTLQRRVKDWRKSAARRPVFAEGIDLTTRPASSA